FGTTPQCEMYFAVTNLRRLCIWPLVPVFAHRFSTPSFITTQMSAAPCIFSTPLAQPGLSDLFSRRAHPFTAFRKRFRSRKTNISLRHLAPTPRPKLQANFCVRHSLIFIKCGWSRCVISPFTVHDNGP